MHTGFCAACTVTQNKNLRGDMDSSVPVALQTLFRSFSVWSPPLEPGAPPPPRPLPPRTGTPAVHPFTLTWLLLQENKNHIMQLCANEARTEEV